MKNPLIIGLLSLALAQNLPAQEITHSELYDFISRFEGTREKPYYKSGVWTVGIGHRLTVANSGLNYLGNPKQSEYSSSEIVRLFNGDTAIAIKAAKRLFPSFDKHNKNIRLLLIDFVFNVGQGNAAKFVKFIGYINRYDYTNAANELVNSLYYNQTGVRAREHVATLKSLVSRG